MENLLLRFVQTLLIIVILTLGYVAVAKSWTWGTMDEPTVLSFTSQAHAAYSVHEKLRILFPSLSDDLSFGRFRPFYAPYIRLRFFVWPSASAQRRLSFLMIMAILIIWRRILVRLQVDQLTIALGFVFGLYFGPFTIAAINFPSIQETPIVLLTSGAILAATTARQTQRSGYLWWAFFFMVAAVLFKETAFCLIPAVIASSWSSGNSKSAKLYYSLMGAIFVFYPLAVNKWVKSVYSAHYDIRLATIIHGGIEGLKNFAWSYKFALPFLLVGLLFRWRRMRPSRLEIVCLLSASLYFLVLVPWTNEMTYYHGPMAVFIGLISAIGATTLLRQNLGSVGAFGIVAIALGSVLATFSIERQIMRTWQFNHGLDLTERYLANFESGENIYVNDKEAATTIPRALTARFGHEFPSFQFAQAETILKSPALILVISGQTRYPSVPIPGNAAQVLRNGNWAVYSVP